MDPQLMIQQLVQMGFDANSAEAALVATGFKSIDVAVEQMYQTQGTSVAATQPITTTSSQIATPTDVKRNASILNAGKLKGDSYEVKLEFEKKKRQAELDNLKQQKIEEKKRLNDLRRRMKEEKRERLIQQEERLARVSQNLTTDVQVVTNKYDLTPLEKPKQAEPIQITPPVANNTSTSSVKDCSIQIRLPSGNTLVMSVTSDKTMQTVYDYIVSNMSDDIGDRFSLMSPIPPRTEYNPDEIDLDTVSLAQAKLVPRGSLIVQKLKSKGKLTRGDTDPMAIDTDNDTITDNNEVDEVTEEDVFIENNDTITNSIYILSMRGPWLRVPEEEKETEVVQGAAKAKQLQIFRPKLYVEEQCEKKKRTAINFLGTSTLSESRLDLGNGVMTSHSGSFKLRYNVNKQRTEITVSMNNEAQRTYQVLSLTEDCLILSTE
jgi:hypothetical protein